MNIEKIGPKKGTSLRKNGSKSLAITIGGGILYDIIMIIGSTISQKITKSDLHVPSDEYYMIINNSNLSDLEIFYDQDISKHEIIYDPYKFENIEKTALLAKFFIEQYDIPKNYTIILPKWYSFKFSYPDYNLIFIKPGLGISFQVHKNRNEIWEILEGEPIIIAGNNVYYEVEKGIKFEIPINTIHSVINPSIKNFVLLKETWTGKFDEKDITRIFNPNNFKEV